MVKKRRKVKSIDKRIIAIGISLIALLILVSLLYVLTAPEKKAVAGQAVGPGGCVMPPEGLVAWWTGDGDAKDSVGNVDGSWMGNVQYSEGGIDAQAFKLDGEGSFIDVGLSEFSAIEGSIALWARSDFNLNNEDKEKWLIGRNQVGQNDGDIGIKYLKDSDNLQFFVENDGMGEAFSDDFRMNWHLYVGTWNSTETEFFIDGASINDNTGINLLPKVDGKTLAIGAERGDPEVDETWNGSIDEVMIFDHALTDDEVSVIYAGRNDGFCKTDCSTAGDVGLYGQNWFCNGQQFIQCQDTLAGTIVGDNQFVCDGTEWLPCSEEGEVVNNTFCMGAEEARNYLLGNFWRSLITGAIFERGGRGGDAVADAELLWVDCDAIPNVVCHEDEAFICGYDFYPVYEPTSIGPGADNNYYCSYNPSIESHEWVNCSNEVLGEGVDNAPNAERYDNRYMCGNSGNPKWLLIESQCRACLGNLPGKCVGSSDKDIADDSESDFYYDDPLTNKRVGCVDNTECLGEESGVKTTFPLRAPFDIDNSIVCSSNNTWVVCDVANENIPSTEGKWMCWGESWVECVTDIEGTRRGNYICTDVSNDFIWYNEFACPVEDKYKLKICNENGCTHLCNGESWINWGDYEMHPIEDVSVEISNSGGVYFVVKEAQCSGGIDEDRDNLIDCADPDCQGVDNDRTLNISEFYEVKVIKDDCFRPNIHAPDDSSSSLRYGNLTLCDERTEDIIYLATVCSDNGTQSVRSAVNLLREYSQPYVDENNLTFFFEEGEAGAPKEASIILQEDITAGDELNLPLSSFTSNFVSGNRLMLLLDGDNYLLWYPEDVAGFDEANLKLTHIATGTTHDANIYPGTNKFTFGVFGNRYITSYVDVKDGMYEIQALHPGESPQSYPVPTNLNEMFEVTFTMANPVRITEPTDTGNLSICRRDVAADPDLVQVCRDDVLELTLEAGTLTNETIGTKDYFLLFEVVNGVKQVSIFSPFLMLSEDEQNLAYRNFIEAMVSGRRAAFEYEGKFYLAKHPITPLISMSDISFIEYLPDGTTREHPASEGRRQVEFRVPDGKVYLKRPPSPELPFNISAIKTINLDNVNLETELYTSMDSDVPVTLATPNLGQIIATEEEEYRWDRDVFNVMINGAEKLLYYLIPHTIKEGLYATFYYDTYDPTVTPFRKGLSIYHTYNLSDTTPRVDNFHAYNNQFKETFVQQGKDIVLIYNNSYYLLGHEGADAFSIGSLVLTSLDKAQSYDLVRLESPNEIKFRVGELEEIFITRDIANAKLIFSASDLPDLETISFLPEDYSIALTTSNKIALGNGLTMCNKDLYQFSTAVSVCNGINDLIIIDTTTDILDRIQTIGGTDYMFEVNGLTGEQKKVLIRRIINVEDEPTFEDDGIDWNLFATHVIAGDKPVINVSNKFFLPVATNNLLQDFALQEYPAEVAISMATSQRLAPLVYSGSIILHDKVVFINQSLQGPADARMLNATFKLQTYDFLPADGSKILLNTSEIATNDKNFVILVDGEVHNLTVVNYNRKTIKLTLDSLINRLFAKGNTKTIALDGQRVEIKIEEITAREAVISLKRVS